MTLPLAIHVIVDPLFLSVLDPLLHLLDCNVAILILIYSFHQHAVEESDQILAAIVITDVNNVSDTLPEPLLAFLRGELVKSFGLLLSQKSFVVVVEVLGIVVFQVAEWVIVMNTALLLGGFAGGINHTEGKAHNKWPQLHPANKHCSNKRKKPKMLLLILSKDIQV